MKILLLGKNGQVGRENSLSLSLLGEVIALSRSDIDFTNLESLKTCIQFHKPDVIVNCVAYTAVDKAETDSKVVHLVNSEAVKVLAEEALKLNSLLVHYSTDYIFDGTKNLPYLEDDLPNPLNIYGKSKLKGDQYIQESGCKYLIFRVSWVYGAYGKNFAKTILKLAKDREELKIVSDQIGAPLHAKLISEVTILALYKMLNQDDSRKFCGTYNISANGETSWYGFAKFLIENAAKNVKLSCTRLLPIPTTDYPLPAKRPLYSKLDSTKLEQVFGISIPDWELHALKLIEEIGENL